MLYPAELPGRSALHYSRKALSRSRAICLLGLLIWASPGTAQSPAPACAEASTPAGGVALIRDRLEIELADGRLLKLAHIAPFEASPRGVARRQNAKAALESWLGSGNVLLPPRLPLADRWGRIETFAATSRGENIGLKLVTLGLARVGPTQSDACFSALLEAEDRARKAKLGLWADSYYSVLAADQLAALSAHSGEYVIAEGRVQRVGQTATRYYLDLGPARSGNLSVTFARHDAKSFAAGGIVPEKLTGQMIRVRGVIEHRPGPLIELFTPAAIEMIGLKL